MLRGASVSLNTRWYSKTVGCVIVELLIDRDKSAEIIQLVCVSVVRNRICMYCLECKSACLYIYVYVRDCVSISPPDWKPGKDNLQDGSAAL